MLGTAVDGCLPSVTNLVTVAFATKICHLSPRMVVASYSSLPEPQDIKRTTRVDFFPHLYPPCIRYMIRIIT